MLVIRLLLCTCGNNRTFRSQDFRLGGYCYSHSFEMPSSEAECWLDSVTLHYCHACLPKIREDASVNIVGDLGMTASRSLNMTLSRLAVCLACAQKEMIYNNPLLSQTHTFQFT